MLSRYSCVASESVSTAKSIWATGPPPGGLHLHEHLAGADVEAGAVARADHLEPLPLALAQRAVVVAASVLERVELAFDAVDAEEERAGLDDFDAALGDLVQRAYADFHSMSLSSEASPS